MTTQSSGLVFLEADHRRAASKTNESETALLWHLSDVTSGMATGLLLQVVACQLWNCPHGGALSGWGQHCGHAGMQLTSASSLFTPAKSFCCAAWMMGAVFGIPTAATSRLQPAALAERRKLSLLPFRTRRG